MYAGGGNAGYQPSLFLGGPSQQSGAALTPRDRALSSTASSSAVALQQLPAAGQSTIEKLRRRSVGRQDDLTPVRRRADPTAPPTAFLMPEFDGRAGSGWQMSTPASTTTKTAAQDDRFETWIVAYGVDEKHKIDPLPVLRALWNYGEVVDHQVGRGNWLFVRFSSKWHAEKVLAQSTFRIDNGATVVGALRPTPDVALDFGLRVASNGDSILSSHSTLEQDKQQSYQPFSVLRAPPTHADPFATKQQHYYNAPYHDGKQGHASDQQHLPPKPPRQQNKSFCAKVMAYIFSW